MSALEEYYEENGDFILGGMKYTEARHRFPGLFSGISDGARRIKQIVEDLKNYVREDTADLTQPVDINAVLKPALTVIDGFVGMEGRGPARGDPVQMDLIIAGKNPV